LVQGQQTLTAGSVAAPAQGTKGRLRAAFAYPDFRLLLWSNLVTQGGQWTQQVGRGWLIVHTLSKAHGELQLGLTAFCTGAAMLISAPLGGVLADRFDRRRVIMATQFGLLIVALAMSILVSTHSIRLWHMYVLSFASGSVFSMNGPTRQALVHDVVEERDLTGAITLNSVVMNSMRVIGPALGGSLVWVAGVQGTFWVQAGCYVLAMSQVMQMKKTNRTKGAARGAFVKNLVEGVRYTRRDALLGPLLLIAFVTGFLGMGYLQLMPAYVTNVLHSDQGRTLGWLLTCEGVGAFIGAVVATAMGDYRHRGRLLVSVVIAFGCLIVVLGLVNSLIGAMLLLVVLGAINSTVLVTNNILIQTNVSDQYRGRVFSLYFLTFSLAPMGVLLGGSIAELISLDTTFIALGGSVAIIVLWLTTRSPSVRRA